MINPLARIRIVDDDPDMLSSWAFLLRSAGFQVSAYSSAKDFLEQDDPEDLGCLVLDIRMPEMSGLELQELLNEERNPLPIIFCSGHASIETCVSALKHGAIDFMEKPVDAAKLIKAIEAACEAHQTRRELVLEQKRMQEKFNSLTGREKDVLFALSKGVSNREAGNALGITEKTVQIHRGSLCKKLGLHSQLEIARVAELFSSKRND